MIDETIRERIRQIFEGFLVRRMRTIRALRIEDLHINPFLIRILAREMKFENAEGIVRWLVMQRSMTGVNTSMGFCLQEIAKLFSEGTGVEGADIQKTKDGRHYYIQVKSGPSTMDKDAVRHMSQLLVSVQRRNRGSIAFLGMCLAHVNRYSVPSESTAM